MTKLVAALLVGWSMTVSTGAAAQDAAQKARSPRSRSTSPNTPPTRGKLPPIRSSSATRTAHAYHRRRHDRQHRSGPKTPIVSPGASGHLEHRACQRDWRPLDFWSSPITPRTSDWRRLSQESNPELLKNAWGKTQHDLSEGGGTEGRSRPTTTGWQDGRTQGPAQGDVRLAKTMWAKLTEAAEKYNQPGRFTPSSAMNGRRMPDGNNLHRNVIFRDGKDKADQIVPFSSTTPSIPKICGSGWPPTRRKRAAGCLPSRTTAICRTA